MDLENKLNQYFGHTSFRAGQKEIIEDVLKGNDVLGVLPTGSGKSICYQLPALLLGGLTIVVSPLISLMIDQVRQLKANHFKNVTALNSFMHPNERRRVLNQLDQYKLIYVSPELLVQTHIKKVLKRADVRLFVIDEAHCISQWGHEFRPDYLKLKEVLEYFGNPTTLALSATATPQVQEDIVHALNKPKMKKRIYPMDKPNIAFHIEKVVNEMGKLEYLKTIISKFRVPTLIYFTSRKTAEKTSQIISKELPNRRVAFYHGGMEQMDRIYVQQQFMDDKLDIICCTSAFGMGINKKDIRLIIHYHFPHQVESFIQETGRAGRDGEPSVSLLLYSPTDVFLPMQLIKGELPQESDVKKVFELIQTQKTVPNESVLDQLQITETQWRFIRFHLEKHGIIRNNYLSDDNNQCYEAFSSIIQTIKERNDLKKKQLTNMLEWIHEEGCLRKRLYRDFQSSYQKATASCCSNCGFQWPNWQEKINTTPQRRQTWDEQLKQLLLLDGK